jgi:hypothetical protein
MKKIVIYSLGLFLGSSLFFTACQKTNTTDSTSTENLTESKVHSDDQALVADETDEITTDASTSVENVIAISGNLVANYFPPPCNATITYDTLNAVRTITITYNGLNCNGTRTRTGVVTISIPAGVLWRNAGAQLTITYTNLKITRVSDGKSITINGSKLITNVSGGLLRNLATLGTITHTITSPGMSITFDNGSVRSWQIAKKRVFTYNNGMVITTTGTHTEGNTNGVSEWGTNRFGNAFVTAIVDPMVIRQDCNFRLTSGHIQHSRLLRTVDVTFGLDANGNPTTCPGLGAYYMKIVWVNAAGNTITVILPY